MIVHSLFETFIFVDIALGLSCMPFFYNRLILKCHIFSKDFLRHYTSTSFFLFEYNSGKRKSDFFSFSSVLLENQKIWSPLADFDVYLTCMDSLFTKFINCSRRVLIGVDFNIIFLSKDAKFTHFRDEHTHKQLLREYISNFQLNLPNRAHRSWNTWSRLYYSKQTLYLSYTIITKTQLITH